MVCILQPPRMKKFEDLFYFPPILSSFAKFAPTKLQILLHPAIPRNIFTYFPSLLNGNPGLYLHPAISLPTIIQSAPTAKALHIFPEFLLPPSEHNGTS